MTKFKGSWDELKAAVTKCGVVGTWLDLGNEKRFDSEDGAVLRWWETTKTIQVQGSRAEAAKLRTGLHGSPPSGVGGANPAPKMSRVFVVHGHDEAALEQLELVLRRLELQPFVLKDSGGDGLTIIEALEQAIVTEYISKAFTLLPRAADPPLPVDPSRARLAREHHRLFRRSGCPHDQTASANFVGF